MALRYSLSVDSIAAVDPAWVDLFREHARIDGSVDARTVAQYVQAAVETIESE